MSNSFSIKYKQQPTRGFESLSSSGSDGKGTFFSKFFNNDDSQKDFGPLPEIEYSEDISKFYSGPVVVTSGANQSVITTLPNTQEPMVPSQQSQRYQQQIVQPSHPVKVTTTHINLSNNNNNISTGNNNSSNSTPEQIDNSSNQTTISNYGNNANNQNNQRFIDVFKSKFQKNPPVVENKKFWMPDHSSAGCYECSALFTTFKRRHHCRLCGQIFCWKCSNNSLVDNKGDSIRVCNFCFKRYTTDDEPTASSNYASTTTHYNQINGNSNLNGHLNSGLGLNSGQGHDPQVNVQNIHNDNSLLANTTLTTSTGTNSNTTSLSDSTANLFNKVAVSITSPFTKGLGGTLSLQSSNQNTSPSNDSTLDDTLLYFKDQEGNYDLVEEDENNLADSDEDDDEEHPNSSSSTSLHITTSTESIVPPPPPNPLAGTDNTQQKTTRSYSMPQKGSITSFSMSSLPSVIKFQKSGHHSTSPPKDYNMVPSINSNLTQSQSIHNNLASSSTVSDDLSLSTGKESIATSPSLQSTDNSSNSNSNSNYSSIISPGLGPKDSAANTSFFSPIKNRQGQQIVITPSSLFFSDPSIVSLKSHPKTTNKSKFLEKYSLPNKFYESNLNNFNVKQSIEKDKISNQPTMEPYLHHISQIITQQLEANQIDVNAWKPIILDFTRKSIDRVRVQVRKGDRMSTNEHIKIKKIPGGLIKECQYIDGVVITKILTHKRMKSKFVNPKILLLSCSVEFQRVENKFLFFDQLLQQEKEYLRILVQKIAEYKPDLVLVEKTVSRHAQDFLLESGISLALNIKPKVLERLGKCLGGEVLPTLDIIQNGSSTSPKTLGTCGQFRIQTYAESSVEGTRKSLMFFEKCQPEFGSTIVLRGESLEKLEAIKKILKFSIYSIRNAHLEIKMIQNSSSFFYKELATGNNCLANGDYLLSCSPQFQFPMPRTYPSGGAWKWKFTSLHSPNKRSLVSSFLNISNTDQGQQQAVLQNTTEDEILGLGTADLLQRFNSPNYKFPIEFESIYDHQSITYSHSIFCNSTQCIPFEIHTINYYTENDLTIGEFLMKCCFNPQNCTIKECNRSLVEHERTFMSNNCRVNICIQRAPPNSNHSSSTAQTPKATPNHNIAIINLCKICKKFSPETQMSSEAWEYSFGKFLESAFYGFLPLSTQADCNHYQVKDHILYFYYQDLAAIFSFENLPRLELSLPPITTRGHLHYESPKQKLVVRKKELELLNECANQVYSAIYDKCIELDEENHDRVKELVPILLEERQLIINRIGEFLIEIPFDNQPIIDLSKTLYANFMTWNSQLLGISNSTSYQRSKRNIQSSFDPDLLNPSNSTGNISMSSSNSNTPIFEKRNVNNQENNESNSSYGGSGLINNNANSNNSYAGGSGLINNANSNSSFGSSSSSNSITSVSNILDNQQSMDYSSPVVQQKIAELEQQKKVLEQQLQQKSSNKPLKIIDTIAGIVSSISSSKILGPTMPYILLDSDSVALYENEPSTTIAYTLSSHDFKVTLQTLMDEELFKPSNLSNLDPNIPTNSPSSNMNNNINSSNNTNNNNNTISNTITQSNSSSFTNSQQTLPPLTNQTQPQPNILNSNNNNSQTSTPGSSSNNSPSPSLNASTNNTPITIENPSEKSSSEIKEIKDDGSFLRPRSYTGSKNKPIPVMIDSLRNSYSSSPSSISPLIVGTPGTLLSTPEKTTPLSLSVQSSPLFKSSNTPTTPIVITPITITPLTPNVSDNNLSDNNTDTNDVNSNENNNSIKNSLNVQELNSQPNPISPPPPTATSNPTTTSPTNTPSLNSIDMYTENNIRLSKLMVSDQRKEIRSRFKFEKNGYEISIFSTSYYPIQFHALREFAVGDQQFIESLTRSKAWNAKGGKSGSSWSKTLDEKYILKQVSRVELESFLEFAPLYFEYLCRSFLHKIPTALCKILGVYSVRWKDSNGKSFKKDLIVMENLFYSRYILKTYDLKGSLRSRLVKNESEVLLDENLLQVSFTTPICLPEYDKTRLSTAVWNDTAFLSSLNVMDYSLLTGIDNQGQLVVGIIDYMRKFTWDKALEMKVKQSGIMGGGGKVPTVISPKQYKIRFRDAMWLYFIMVPDKFTKVNHLLSPQTIKKKDKEKLLKELNDKEKEKEKLNTSINGSIVTPLNTSPNLLSTHNSYKNQIFI